MASATTVADRYARAIFELGVESNSLSAVAEEVQAFAAAYEANADFRAVIENPVVPPDQRAAVLREVGARLGLGELAKKVVSYLAQRRRLAVLPDIARRLAALSDEKEGVARAVVTSAGPLPESFYGRLAEELGALV